jgi:DNA (cytosine-5)-methyltransferase 1
MGLKMELVCVNHWGVAIETHKKNHPEARHYVQDISTVRPHLMVPEGYLDLLMASPTCTHHSVARGGKPTSDQQRSDPWHIITWLTELRVKRLIIENVWEFAAGVRSTRAPASRSRSARANISRPGSMTIAAWALSRNGAS